MRYKEIPEEILKIRFIGDWIF